MALVQFTPVAKNNIAFTMVQNVNPIDILDVRATTTAEQLAFPSANSVLIKRTVTYNQPGTITYFSAATPATLLAAVATAQAGVLGSGVSGQTTLVAGTKAVTITGLTTTSVVVITLASNANDSLTVKYRAVCTANTLTITALLAAGTINTADTSVVNYAVVG